MAPDPRLADGQLVLNLNTDDLRGTVTFWMSVVFYSAKVFIGLAQQFDAVATGIKNK